MFIDCSGGLPAVSRHQVRFRIHGGELVRVGGHQVEMICPRVVVRRRAIARQVARERGDVSVVY